MKRAVVLLLCVLGTAQALAVDRPAVLLEAKIAYLKQAAEARKAYLNAIDDEVTRLEAAGDREAARNLKGHRGAWLLGDVTAEEYREFESEGAAPGHLQAVDAYISAHTECRATLKSAYDAIIKEAKFIRRNEEASNYEGELDFFQSGDYVPTPIEVIKPQPYRVRRIQWNPPLAAPRTARKIPDQLHVEFREHRFSISGVRRGGGARTRGGHGKGVVFSKEDDGPATLRGYLMIGTRDPGVKYAVFTTNRTQLTLALSLDELELDTVYSWSVDMIRDEFRVEIRNGGEVVASTRAFGGRGADFGFCATVSDAGTRARLAVAIE